VQGRGVRDRRPGRGCGHHRVHGRLQGGLPRDILALAQGHGSWGGRKPRGALLRVHRGKGNAGREYARREDPGSYRRCSELSVVSCTHRRRNSCQPASIQRGAGEQILVQGRVLRGRRRRPQGRCRRHSPDMQTLTLHLEKQWRCNRVSTLPNRVRNVVSKRARPRRDSFAPKERRWGFSRRNFL